jgi:hypothetical protein
MKLDKIFYNLGYKISKHPILVTIASLLITGLLMTGLMFLEFEVNKIIF